MSSEMAIFAVNSFKPEKEQNEQTPSIFKARARKSETGAPNIRPKYKKSW